MILTLQRCFAGGLENLSPSGKRIADSFTKVNRKKPFLGHFFSSSLPPLLASGCSDLTGSTCAACPSPSSVTIPSLPSSGRKASQQGSQNVPFGGGSLQAGPGASDRGVNLLETTDATTDKLRRRDLPIAADQGHGAVGVIAQGSGKSAGHHQQKTASLSKASFFDTPPPKACAPSI